MIQNDLNKAKLALHLNQAEHNALMIIKEIVRKIVPAKVNSFKSEEDLAEQFYNFCAGYYSKRLDLQRITELLQFYFPFTGILAKDEPDPEKAEKAIVEKFSMMLIVLNAFRNHCSHYTEHESILHDGYLKKDFMKQTDPGRFPGLKLFDKEGYEKPFNGRSILMAVRKTVNAIYKKAVVDKIDQEYHKHSNENRSVSKKNYKYASKLYEIEKAFAPLLKITRNYEGDEKKEIPVALQLFRDKREQQKDANGKVIFDEKSKRPKIAVKIEAINPDGLLYFICLFLNSGDANRLISGTPGFKRSDDLIWESKRLVYRHFCCKPPRSRLRSVAMTDDSLLLDIIGELQKCPDEIYRLLDDGHRQKFLYGTDVYFNDNDEKVENETLQKRYENRFPYFALRYLDSLNLNLRFQLTLGKVNMKKYEKHFMGQNIERRLQKEVKVFDRLCNYPYENDVDDDGTVTRQAVSKLIGDSLEQEPLNKDILLLQERQNTSEDANNWQYFAPHYNFENNTIALRLEPHTFKQLCGQAKGNKFGLPHLKQPDAILSIYELPQLVWFAMEQPEKVGSFILGVIKRYKHEFNLGIEANGKNNPIIYKHDFPKPIYPILINKRTKPIDKVQGITSVLLEDNNQSREQAEKWLDTARQKGALSKKIRGTNWHTVIPKGKRGTIATWITKDIIWLCTPNARTCIGQTMADALQEHLAIYSSEKLKELFNYTSRIVPVNIIIAHPFIGRVASAGNLFDFYTRYLDNRSLFFNEQNNLALKGINKTRFPDLFGVSADLKSLENYLKPFKTTVEKTLTVNLAKGAFNKKLMESLTKRGINPAENAQGFPPFFSFNFSLGKLYPPVQEFYGYPRIYKRFENGVEQEQHIFSDLESAKKTASATLFKIINENEKQLRQHQTEDRMLFLMAGQLSGKLFGTNIFAENTLADFFSNNVWEKRRLFNFSIGKNLPKIAAEVVLKDAGIFTKLLADKRLETLLAYFNTPVVNYLYQLPPGETAKAERLKNNAYYFDAGYQPNLKDELQFFEDVREALFAECLGFEKYVLEWAALNNRLGDFNTFYRREGYSNHRVDFILPLATLFNPLMNNELFSEPVKLETNFECYNEILCLSIMNQVRNCVSHNNFFEHKWRQLFTTHILDTPEKMTDFIAYGEMQLRNYYAVEEQNAVSVNLREERKAQRSPEAGTRAKIRIRFFKEFCLGRQTAFIAEWWYIAYKYMICKIKEELKNRVGIEAGSK